MLHSHPQWKENREDNDLFSPGDAIVSVLSGKIYLTTPHGNLYALEKEDGKGLILSGVARDLIVTRDNLTRSISEWGKSKLSEDAIHALQVAYPWPFLGEYLYNKITKPAMDTFVKENDSVSAGRNFQTFNAKSYDTRQ
ncbi:MAG: hypothetical protein E7330_03605 [Clostridiales bacterium]|nr:hypothetical protein [Clostridiales bacterium]